MSNQSFKVKNGLTLSPIDLTSLLSPQAGDLACDINDSNKIKRYDALSASWVEVGSGASGDVDTLLVQDFDSASLSSFTQTGLTLITTNPLDGRQSARLIHQPLVGAIQSFKETFSVSPKFRGVNMTASLLLRSSASQGNVTIQFRDETNSVDYPSQQLQTNSQVIASLVTNSTTTVSGFSNSVINSLKVGMSVTGSGIPTGTTIAAVNSTALSITLSQAATASATVSLRFSDLPRTIQLGFQIPANCSSYSYTISALQEAGSPETYVDDIVLKNYWLGMSNQGQSEIQTQIIEQQSSNIDQTASFAAATITGVLTSSDGLSLYSYNSTTGIYTALKDIKVDLNASMRTAASSTITPQIYINSIMAASSVSAAIAGTYGNVSTSKVLSAGSTWYFSNASVNITNAQIISVSAQAITTSTTTVNDLVPAKAVLGNTSLEIPNVTSWQGYTPTFQGFGTPSAIEFEWRQVGENVEIRGKFAVGTTTATEARIGLPSGLISANTNLIPSIQNVGTFSRSSVTSGPGTWSTLIEPSVSYMTLGVFNVSFGGLSKRNGNDISVVSGELLSLFASIPCAGLSATEEVVVSGTQSALVQEADSYLRITGFTPVVGSVANKIITLISATYNQNIGDAIQYLDDAVNGARFIAQKEGLYRFEFSADVHTTAGIGIGFSKNTTSTTTSFIPLPASEKIAVGYDTGSNNILHVFGEVYLSIGDIVRIHTDSATSGANATWSTFTASYQGSLKQLNVSSDQKITIPTSELRFEGASTRGSTATAIVRFDTLTKLRGDAFTVESDSILGTRITMRKAGRLSVSASVYINSASGATYISENQAILTSSPVASEQLSAGGSTSSVISPVAWNGDVAIGDIIRISTNAAPTSNASNHLNLSFQEQDISVSVTNTLPQFSESDSSVRVDTANGYGSTATKIRRFSNVRDNIGSDIEYLDSATNGASFTIRSSGIYNISYSDNFSVDNGLGISKNASSLTTNIDSLSGTERLAISTTNSASYSRTVSWQGYLSTNDIIRAHTNGAASGDATRSQFTISKVGKPNVTGVDVTPFVNVPQPITENYVASLNSSMQPSTVIKSSNSGLFTVSTPVANRIRFTALKNISVNASGALSFSAAAPGATAQWYLNSVTLLKFNQNYASAGSIEVSAEASVEIQLSTGDYIEFLGNQYVGGTFAKANVSVLATALSDQILTAPETFSTDTASLTYAGSGSYTLSTLTNAPVGTFITFTYAANTNTRTQTTTAPSQTTADMNVNGIQLFTRAYTAASTAASPAAIAIQIGKGLKGKSLDLYKSAGKVTAGALDYYAVGSGASGILYKDYNEVTGILVVDAGVVDNTATSVHNISFSDVTTQTSGYLVINASKNPALTGIGLNRVAARAVNTSGQSIPNTGENIMLYDSIKTYDTHNALNTSTGVFTAPETGYYEASWSCFFSMTSNLGQVVTAILYKNGVSYSGGAYNTMDRAVAIDAGSTGACGIYLVKGDTVDIRIYNNRAGGATNLNTTARHNFFSISKVSV